jgi:single-strand DNA-binding protein
MEAKFSISGKLFEKFSPMQLKNNFSKREFVLETKDNPKYPQYLKFELQNDNCSLLDSYNNGDEIVVNFDLRGRPYTNPKGDKIYFTNLVAWRLSGAAARPKNEDDFGPESQLDAPGPEMDVPF